MGELIRNMDFERTTLDHSSLGSITGRLLKPAVDYCHGKPSAGVAHFRSIPFATVPERFRQSILLSEGLPDEYDGRPKGDFTQYGFACPQIPQATAPVGGLLRGERERVYDEFKCLNLTVTAPVENLPGTVGKKKLLPVMVYVHGGAFAEGAGNISAVHEMVKSVELASRENLGIVAVNITYRLNWQGFLACRDLIEEQRETGEHGQTEPVFNYGLRDQRNAFAWIKKHVGGFGGNPDNITAFGESAGASSLAMHICSDVPVFNRAILQSHADPALQSLEQHDALYYRLLDYLHIQANSAAQRLHLLRAVPIQVLIDAISALSIPIFGPCSAPESGFFPKPPFHHFQSEIMAKNEWLEDVMVGDCFNEGWIFHQAMKLADPTTLTDTFKSVFGAQGGSRILTEYGIDADGTMDRNLFWTNSNILIGDIFFSEPAHAIANTLVGGVPGCKKRHVYRYSVCISNPFPGSPFSFVAGHHFVDVLFQFMTLTYRYPTHRDNFLARQATEMARKWIRFGNGLAPWSEYDAEKGSIAIFDDLRGWQVRTRSEDEEVSATDPWGKRRYTGWNMLREGLSKKGQLVAYEGPQAVAESIEAARSILLNIGAYKKSTDKGRQ